MPWRWVLCGLLLLTAAGCDACSTSTPGANGVGVPDAGAQGGLTPEQAGQVLATVGERTITLGDFAAALERMDPFERMRYQTDDRRQALLDEMINVELLAREAERRGLDRRPETIELVRQFQRDELLARLRASLPDASQLPEADVSRYYQEHRAEFAQPELRQAAEIVLDDAATARRLAREAAGASPDRWRELVQKYAPDSVTDTGDKTTARPPLAVPGDLGFLSALPDEPADPVPAALRKAVFEIPKAGDVYPEPVVVGGRQHVLRLVSVREARQQLLAEVDSLIRVRLVEARQAEARQALIASLRQTQRVTIDETALQRIEPALPARSAPPPPAP
jgi:peptidyl-prolyl cis-trans isomerase C